MKADDFFNAFTLAIVEFINGENKALAYQKKMERQKEKENRI
jgi:hypothetical protein